MLGELALVVVIFADAQRAAQRQRRVGRPARRDVVEHRRLARLDEVTKLPAEYPGWMLERQGENRRELLENERR